MRLICPNCDAQYEVADDVIPTDGRDVQCSNCGQTWFQHHHDHMPPAEEIEDEADALPEPDDAPVPDEDRVPAQQRRTLDVSVADILRQEAEIESRARAQAGSGLESQPELGLSSGESDSERRNREASERMARMRGETTAEAAATAAAIGSRRDLLPDIEEINSTLRSTSDRQAGATAEMADAEHDRPSRPRSSGFRRGFMFMVILALLLVAIYIAAPQIARSLPQTDPYLSGYVAQVDVFRGWLNGKIMALLTWLDAVASSQNVS